MYLDTRWIITCSAHHLSKHNLSILIAVPLLGQPLPQTLRPCYVLRRLFFISQRYGVKFHGQQHDWMDVNEDDIMVMFTIDDDDDRYREWIWKNQTKCPFL